MPRWDRIAAELHAYRDAQRQRWGDISDQTIADFVTGTCSQAERIAVWEAMERFPAVRDLVDDLEQVLGVSALREGEVAESSAVSDLVDRGTGSVWELVEGIWRLLDPVVAWLTAEGDLVAQGLAGFRARPALTDLFKASDQWGEPGRARLLWREIPLDRFDALLSISLGQPNVDGEWPLILELNCPDASIPSSADLIVYDDADRQEFVMPLFDCLNTPVLLKAGHWRVSISIGEQCWEIPLRVGIKGT